MNIDISKIRNFSIIAHIDHGKSTLADRFLEITGAITEREKKEQLLDDMELERERGITIKAHPVTLSYKALDGNEYILNLIDTPGHVDFSYEVSRSLAACEGALLLVDATQGIEAQTVANVHLALENDLEIIPVINKIDMPYAMVDEVKHSIMDFLGVDEDEIFCVSAKTGQGVKDVLEAVVKKIPHPENKYDERLRALIFDSYYDNYRGVVTYIRLFSGNVKRGDKIKFMATEREYEVNEIGIFTPKPKVCEKLECGQVGYMVANVKDVSFVKIGDTITHKLNPAEKPLPGFKEMKPVVFSGMYPVDVSDYEELKSALSKLKLNDASFTYEIENSAALGFGFRCGFLGLLHMEIIQERIEREFGINIIMTLPSVIYEVVMKNGEVKKLSNPVQFPDKNYIEEIREPFVKMTILTPTNAIGGVMQLIKDKRGELTHTESISSNRVMLTVEMPLSEILVEFYDRLKSITRGYGSMDYELAGYKASEMEKLTILLNGERVDALTTIVHKDKVYQFGRKIVEKLKTLIPRHLFAVPIQAAVGGKIIARETVKALKKNVTAKCYGGDITRKKKLWEKQKEGKKRMKEIGKVRVPKNIFVEVLKTS